MLTGNYNPKLGSPIKESREGGRARLLKQSGTSAEESVGTYCLNRSKCLPAPAALAGEMSFLAGNRGQGDGDSIIQKPSQSPGKPLRANCPRYTWGPVDRQVQTDTPVDDSCLGVNSEPQARDEWCITRGRRRREPHQAKETQGKQSLFKLRTDNMAIGRR